MTLPPLSRRDTLLSGALRKMLRSTESGRYVDADELHITIDGTWELGDDGLTAEELEAIAEAAG